MAEHDYLNHYLLEPGDIYVEGGAYFGRHGFLAEKMGARAILIEPSPQACTHIEEMIKTKNLRNVVVVKKALWNHKGFMYFTRGGGAGNRLSDSREILVEVDTLPGILNELRIPSVNLFACDIEGAEVEVVKDLHPRRFYHVALASYHLGSDEAVKAKIIDVLTANGYWNVKYEGGTVYAPC